MIKRELRIAVVIYGGASLAIYMHGVTKELLKLVRASKVFHELGRERALHASYEEGADHRGGDTEAVYFELIKRINRHCHFRVVIDVIAGASAGAINGMMLGKAIVDDGLLEVQTPMWLADADADYLAAPRRRGQKWYLYPLLRMLAHWLPKEIGSNPETRDKLARFVRSSWFQPPFSGELLCTHFLDALEALVGSRREGSSLLPRGQRLDVYASITDLVGYPTTIRLHDELVASDREHGAYCRLMHGDGRSDFRDDNLPALVWAARASSSFAGAFPPFRHEELMQLLASRSQSWPGESGFLAGNLFVENDVPASQVFDPRERQFVDGGIVNNKPFGSAMAALNQRPADRHVDRFIVYIEPDPKVPSISAGAPLGYLGTLHAALSTIPRNQPILEELNDIVDQDKRVLINRRLVSAHQAEVMATVDRLARSHESQPISADLIAYLRASMMEEAAADMGTAYSSYAKRRVWRLTEALMEEWVLLAEQPHLEETRTQMLTSIESWWASDDEQTRRKLEEDFLEHFDVTFRIRRLQFVIRRLNQHMEEAGEEADAAGVGGSATRDAIDEFKSLIYRLLERLYELRQARKIEDALLERLFQAAQRLPLERQEVRALLRDLSGSLDLNGIDQAIDDAFFRFLAALDSAGLKQRFLSDYVGFPVYDVLLYTPGSRELGPDPLTRIRVERISPNDSPVLDEAFGGLRSLSFMGFLGFFNRGYREHDYLWGRLNGAERIVDLLVNTVPEAIEDPLELKAELFGVIVQKEKRRLYRCDDELREIEALLAGLAGQS